MIKLPDKVRIYINPAELKILDTVENFRFVIKITYVSLRLKEKE